MHATGCRTCGEPVKTHKRFCSADCLVEYMENFPNDFNSPEIDIPALENVLYKGGIVPITNTNEVDLCDIDCEEWVCLSCLMSHILGGKIQHTPQCNLDYPEGNQPLVTASEYERMSI